MIRLGRNEFAFGRDVEPEEIEARIDAVTAGDVQALAQDLLSESNQRPLHSRTGRSNRR